jgi:ribonuclease VapC
VIVDSSALVAIFPQEPDHDALLQALADAPAAAVGAPTLVKLASCRACGFVSMRGRSSSGPSRFRDRHRSFRRGPLARGARRVRPFGKGKHPAALNLGDCFSYAVASLAEQPLLCVGSDFGKTDLKVVPA